MHRLKSIFISLAITYWLSCTIFLGKDTLSWPINLYAASSFLGVLVPVLFFSLLLLYKPTARTQPQLPFITGLQTLSTIIALSGVFLSKIPYLYGIISFIGLLLWVIYVKWYSVLPAPKAGPKVGKKLPSLLFYTNDGTVVRLDKFNKQKKLLLFYRGNWCPLCMAQIKEIAAAYKQLEHKGVAVLLISPQPASHSAKLAKKMKVNFYFLTDKNNAMARQLGIDHPHGTPLGMEIFGYTSDTVLPTVLLADEQNNLVWVDQTDNYRLRPEPKLFLEKLNELDSK